MRRVSSICCPGPAGGLTGGIRPGTIRQRRGDREGWRRGCNPWRHGHGRIRPDADQPVGCHRRFRPGERYRPRPGDQLCRHRDARQLRHTAGQRASGYRPVSARPWKVQMSVAEVTETLVVTAESPLVDVTKTQAGQDITLQLTESLPTARTYQDYLQLVPGVQDTIGIRRRGSIRPPVPASTTSDDEREGGDVGLLDRQFLLLRRHQRHRPHRRHRRRRPQHRDHPGAERAHRRDPGGVRRRPRPDLQRRHQERRQPVLRLGQLLPAERQLLVDEATSRRTSPTTRSRAFDAAATLGGPIWKDKAWFFASYRQTERERDVSDETGNFLRTP